VRGIRNMREQYDSFCIPVFYAPHTSMGASNDYSCDFINVGITNTSYVVLHEDRPAGAPECCMMPALRATVSCLMLPGIIGRPFHGPPRNFSASMPIKWREAYNGTDVWLIY
jgi:hypothetical protein